MTTSTTPLGIRILRRYPHTREAAPPAVADLFRSLGLDADRDAGTVVTRWDVELTNFGRYAGQTIFRTYEATDEEELRALIAYDSREDRAGWLVGD